jgi:predicted ester cyclase
MSVEQTAKVMHSYLHEPGRDRIADDAVYTLMGTGRQARGRAEVERFLDHLYQEAFRAKYQLLTLVVGDGSAALEAEFIGEHIGEFEGIAASGQEVRLPMCVVYAIAGEHVQSAHVYLDLDSLRRQAAG